MNSLTRLTEEHLRALMTSCEVVSRLSSGQLRTACQVIAENNGDLLPWGSFSPQMIIEFNEISSENIPSNNETSRICTEIMQLIRRELAYREDPDGGFLLKYDPVMKTTDIPLPKIEPQHQPEPTNL